AGDSRRRTPVLLLRLRSPRFWLGLRDLRLLLVPVRRVLPVLAVPAGLLGPSWLGRQVGLGSLRTRHAAWDRPADAGVAPPGPRRTASRRRVRPTSATARPAHGLTGSEQN